MSSMNVARKRNRVVEVQAMLFDVAESTATAGSDCGANAPGGGGFQPGNTCGSGDDGIDDLPDIGVGDVGGLDELPMPKIDDVEDLPDGLSSGSVGDVGDLPEELEPIPAPQEEDFGNIRKLTSKLESQRVMAKRGVYTEEQLLKGIETYTGDDHFEKINEMLRKGTDIEAVPTPEIKALHHAAKTKLKEPVTTYRGVSESVYKQIFSTVKKGSVVEMKGIVSTSVDPRIASEFGQVIMRIKAKRGVYLGGLSTHDEREFVMAHKSRYRVMGIGKIQVAGDVKTVIDMEEVLR